MGVGRGERICQNASFSLEVSHPDPCSQAIPYCGFCGFLPSSCTWRKWKACEQMAVSEPVERLQEGTALLCPLQPIVLKALLGDTMLGIPCQPFAPHGTEFKFAPDLGCRLRANWLVREWQGYGRNNSPHLEIAKRWGSSKSYTLLLRVLKPRNRRPAVGSVYKHSPLFAWSLLVCLARGSSPCDPAGNIIIFSAASAACEYGERPCCKPQGLR